MQTVKDIRKTFIDKLKNEEFVIDKTGVKTVEILAATFIADEPAIFGTVNQDYLKREIDWYESQSLYVKDIPGGPPQIWQQVASSEGKINSNYGFLIFSEDNYNQFDSCARQLELDSFSRRGIMIYTRPSIQLEYNLNGMSDFICTNTIQYFIRDNKLICCVSMRSNDAIFGYKNDYHWNIYVQQKLLKRLKITYPLLECGDIIWNSNSLHIYQRHFELIK